MAESAHGHLCAGQILGVRMAMLGCERLGIDEPRGPDRKRLVTFVEIDRCATDAIGVVTGCRLGKRALKFRDWGKMAATFVDLAPEAVPATAPSASPPANPRRSAPATSTRRSKTRTSSRCSPTASSPTPTSSPSSGSASPCTPREFPGYKADRIACARCGEGINYDRFVERDGQRLCHACASPDERYYQPL